MEFFTWAQIKAKVEADLDLEGEEFITEPELMGVANEAIRDVEKAVHSLNEDYFLKSTPLTLVQGQEDYDFPADIYGMKIRGLIYRNGASTWPIKKVKPRFKLEEYEADKASGQNSQQYGFFIVNSTAGSPKIRFTPTPSEAGTLIQMWYIRSANRFADDSSICDIPEAVNYVIQCIKIRCYEKEGNPRLEKALMDRDVLRQEVLDALAEMTPDNESSEIQPDTSFYEEMN